MIYNTIEALAAPLPEEIARAKWAGDFDFAMELIDTRLKMDLPDMLRARLLLEGERITRLARQYPFNRNEALSAFRDLVPDIREEEFEALERKGKIDFIYVGGEKRYFLRFHRTLVSTIPSLAERAGLSRPQANYLDDAIAAMKEKGELTCRIRLRATLVIEEDSFVPGETYRVHLPIPAHCAQVSDVQILETEPAAHLVAPETHPQRTVYFEETLEKNRPFSVAYEYTCHMRYADLEKPAPRKPLYPNAAPPCEADLAEQNAHIRFTPYLRSLAAEIIGEETDKKAIARAIYNFITTRVEYAFVRNYLQIDDIAETTAVNLRGDCGMQSLLFITLCRIAGIPARWQSGLAVEPNSAGSHDWAQFYLDGYGWLFCDCSYGGGAYLRGQTEHWNFYFGNLDPFRMPANSAYQHSFTPPKAFLRNDPYDNQTGECEIGSRALHSWELDDSVEVERFSLE